MGVHSLAVRRQRASGDDDKFALQKKRSRSCWRLLRGTGSRSSCRSIERKGCNEIWRQPWASTPETNEEGYHRHPDTGLQPSIRHIRLVSQHARHRRIGDVFDFDRLTHLSVRSGRKAILSSPLSSCLVYVRVLDVEYRSASSTSPTCRTDCRVSRLSVTRVLRSC